MTLACYGALEIVGVIIIIIIIIITLNVNYALYLFSTVRVRPYVCVSVCPQL